VALKIPLTLEPMEAEAVDELPPAGRRWQFEPKIDGFRCIIVMDGDEVHLQSRRQKPLEQVLEGELVIPNQPSTPCGCIGRHRASKNCPLRYHPSSSPSTFSLVPAGHAVSISAAMRVDDPRGGAFTEITEGPVTTRRAPSVLAEHHPIEAFLAVESSLLLPLLQAADRLQDASQEAADFL